MSEYIVRMPPDMPYEIQAELNAWYIESEPIVRCKDCKGYRPGELYGWCSTHMTAIPREDGFCAWGKRKEEYMTCCCSLAGTAACDSCRNRPSMFATGTTFTPAPMVTYVPERTCHIVCEEYDDLLEHTSVEFSCGHYAIGLPSYFNYCPKCGAKVVDE